MTASNPAALLTGNAAAHQRGQGGIAVEIVDAANLVGIRADWADLLERADSPNAFMDPTLLSAAGAAHPDARLVSLLATRFSGGRRQLVGAWTFALGRPRRSLLLTRVLNSPASDYGYLASPVIDRDRLDETLAAMLDRLADDPALPKIVALDMMATDSATHAALLRVLAGRGATPCQLEATQRPKLASDLDGQAYLEAALSSSTRKKLRQHRRRLAEEGVVTSQSASDPAAVGHAVDAFLAIEAAGWKGRNGTALLDKAADAAFMRAAMVGMAAVGAASVHSLCLDGRPLSVQLVLRSGKAAFTWKTAYDEAFRDFSPGMLLLEDYTRAFLADKGIAYVDSCSFDDIGFMSAWTQRQPVADLWIDVRRGGSVQFRVVGALQKAYRAARAGARRSYLNWRTRKSRQRKGS